MEKKFTPITTKLRRASVTSPEDDVTLMFDPREFNDLCDEIDSVHASLEKENAALRSLRYALLSVRDQILALTESDTR